MHFNPKRQLTIKRIAGNALKVRQERHPGDYERGPEDKNQSANGDQSTRDMTMVQYTVRE